MKNLIKVLTHPILLVVLFCLLIIVGEKFGAFYIVYIMLALPHMAIHALLGVLGITLLIASSYSIRDGWKARTLNVIGAFSMAGSLIRFFTQSGGRYNYQTFRETFPLSVFCLFAILITVFIIVNVVRLIKPDGEKNNYFLL